MFYRGCTGGLLGHGMYSGVNSMWYMPHLFLGGLAVLLVIALVIILVRRNKKSYHHDDTEEILRRRYANGEITEEEYLKMKNLLK